MAHAPRERSPYTGYGTPCPRVKLLGRRTSPARYNEHAPADIRSPERNVEGYSDYAEIVNVVERLQARGHSDRDVHKIFGENLLRVFEEV